MAKDKKPKDEEKEPEEGAAEGGETKGKSKKKLIIIIAAAILLLGGGGAGLYFSGVLGGHGAEEGAEEGKEEAKDKTGKKDEKKTEKDAKKEEKKEEKKAEKGEKKEGKESPPLPTGPGGVVYMDLPSFLVNLNAADGKKSAFLKMSITLELASVDDQPQVELMRPRLVDTFNTYLRELRPSDLNGSAGLQRLREELMVRVNESVHPAKVNDILFKEVIVQ